MNFIYVFEPRLALDVMTGREQHRSMNTFGIAVLLLIMLPSPDQALITRNVVRVEHLGRWLRRPTVRTRIEQVTASLLIAVAARLLTESP